MGAQRTPPTAPPTPPPAEAPSASAEYLADLKRSAFAGAPPDADRRHVQRVYVQRLEALLGTAAASPTGVGAGGGGAAQRAVPFVTAPSLAQSDLPAMARMQLREIQREARASARAAVGATARAHWSDIADRVTAILEPR